MNLINLNLKKYIHSIFDLLKHTLSSDKFELLSTNIRLLCIDHPLDVSMICMISGRAAISLSVIYSTNPNGHQ